MPSLKLTGERIRLARRMLGLTRKGLENKFQVSANTLQSWESGKNTLTVKGAKKLNEAFIQLGLLCSQEWLLTGKGQIPTLMQGTSGMPDEINEDFRILQELESFKAINPDPTVLIISDDAMEPLYEVGDYIGGNKKFNENIKNIIGENCIIETFQEDILVRKLLAGDKNDTYNLACLNIYTHLQPIIPNVKVRWAAKIVLHRKKEILKN